MHLPNAYGGNTCNKTNTKKPHSCLLQNQQLQNQQCTSTVPMGKVHAKRPTQNPDGFLLQKQQLPKQQCTCPMPMGKTHAKKATPKTTWFPPANPTIAKSTMHQPSAHGESACKKGNTKPKHGSQLPKGNNCKKQQCPCPVPMGKAHAKRKHLPCTNCAN